MHIGAHTETSFGVHAAAWVSSYDFDSNEDWKAHFRNVELPAGSAADAALLKVKAKWYKKNVVGAPCNPLLAFQTCCQHTLFNTAVDCIPQSCCRHRDSELACMQPGVLHKA